MRNLLRTLTGSWWLRYDGYSESPANRPTVGVVEPNGVVRWSEWTITESGATLHPREHVDMDEDIDWLRGAVASDAEDSPRGQP